MTRNMASLHEYQKGDGALIVVPSSLLFGRLLEWVVWSVSRLARERKAAENHHILRAEITFNLLLSKILLVVVNPKRSESCHKIIDPLYNIPKLMSMIATIYSHEMMGHASCHHMCAVESNKSVVRCVAQSRVHPMTCHEDLKRHCPPELVQDLFVKLKGEASNYCTSLQYLRLDKLH